MIAAAGLPDHATEAPARGGRPEGGEAMVLRCGQVVMTSSPGRDGDRMIAATGLPDHATEAPARGGQPEGGEAMVLRCEVVVPRQGRSRCPEMEPAPGGGVIPAMEIACFRRDRRRDGSFGGNVRPERARAGGDAPARLAGQKRQPRPGDPKRPAAAGGEGRAE
ncbi:hypothetical protein LNKW23_20910 [Paralimibaculum aggregatum]|uniref:Uncharacterized protein n=1 Tax=Paralimibaculum aggregatum TaxID=3036245 RepID=A0ABQ6LHW2_9RHOB|nr:hypothetical protein [Limibaculum sp. NKW23]GMG82878.1 hypothetical protein LNKW23_20910 [Limibaculum sp. NKW23]